MIVTIAEAKEYLRVDTDDEDALLETLIKAAEQLCCDVARLEVKEYESAGEVAKIAVLYTLRNFYQNREESDQKELTLEVTIRELSERIRARYLETSRNQYGDIVKVIEIERCRIWAKVYPLTAKNIEKHTARQ